MYLKRLEIQGFKSFADKVELEFNLGITVVVGPNGSGKSNVVDAIRWVLGEQSAKTLRGLRMDDIIFSGSNNRRPLGMAQVSLTLDNTSGLFPLDYNEVTVSRRLYRSGESEYLINKVPCRMKDIHQLFMDTGVGKEGFSVIGQGKIDEILSLKAEDRRSLIEEAAGIVKYRYRKKETERKLDDTQQSLVRINDIVYELTEQLEPLKEQAEKAKQYQSWKKELDKWEISIAIQAIEENERKEKEIKELLSSLEDNLTRANTQYHQFSSQLESHKFENQQLDQYISNLQQKIYDLNTEIERKEHQIEMSRERKTGVQAQLHRVNLEIENSQKQEEDIVRDISKKKSELAKINFDYNEAVLIVKELSEAINQQKNIFSNNTMMLEDYKSQVIETLQEKAGVNNQISRLDNEIALLQRRYQQLEDKINKASLELDNLEAQRSLFEEKKRNLMGAKNELEFKLITLQKNLAENTLSQVKVKKDLEEKQLNYQQIFSRLQVLEEMEDSGEGYQQGVKAVLEAKKNKSAGFTGIVGTVTDLISVPANLETALETALGGALQYLITNDDQAAQLAIEYLKKEKKGRATFLPLNTIKSSHNNMKFNFPQVVGRAVDLIEFDAKYQNIMEHLLGRVWVIENLESLVEIGKKTNFSHRMVTLDGEVMTPGGALTGGNYRKQKTGLLTRKRMLKELSKELVKKSEDIEGTKQNLQIKEQELQKFMNSINNNKDLLHENELSMADLENKLEQVFKEITRVAEEKEACFLEQQEIQAQKIINNQEKKKLSREIQNKGLLITDMEKEVATLQNYNKEIAAAQDGLIEDLNEKKITTATLQQAQDLGQDQLVRLESSLLNFAQEKSRLQAERNQLDTKTLELNQSIKEIEEEVGRLTKGLVDLEKHGADKKEKRLHLQEILNHLEKEIKNKQVVVEQLREETYQHNLKLSKIQMEINTSREKLTEQFGYSIEEALHHKVEIQNKRNVIKRVNELKGFISDLGLVNFAAILEYEKVYTRLDFLTKQLTDLNGAKDSLLKVIKEMDQIMLKKFRETFSMVNEAFNSVFKEMFGGGSASLELSDEENLLDTGIEIIAQPPGKKAQNLLLLSGGERAMTAIALLFAILKVKPSPFCVLDEIEAALDEANVDRFSAFLKQFVQKTQFIIISHRKGTMEVADVLYGVTIEEQTGVSKLISVKLSEAI
ncbi:MAG: hypothetical protein JM58_17490 [Peptococcaceae bacterium BICA1-8]|nr:MAG: hypothetical protein JM58_17490 [Peptococcaceae bacterium BICA1-8]